MNEERHGGGGGHHHGHPGGRRSGRLFDYGELRVLILALIADGPSHGYELIKIIEERFAGAYTPSPGVIYPTLSWLEDMGYAAVDTQEGGRKQYRITREGSDFLKTKKAEADELFSRTGQQGGPPRHAPAPVIRAMENLKTALRLRLRQGAVEEQTIETIAAAIDAAAKQVEKSK